VGQWVYLGTPVSTTNKTDCYDVAEIFLKVALNTITSLWQKLSGKLAQKKIFYLRDIGTDCIGSCKSN
jgi:hypothetical protein